VYDFLLFAHVLSAFCLGAMTVMYSSFALGAAAPRGAVRTAQVLDGIGGVGTIVFGIWLALYIDGYELWDGWIIAAIVLWAAAAETGRRSHSALMASGTAVADNLMARWHWIRALLIVALLADMIWKPGA
jgi:hypothetical protein